MTQIICLANSWKHQERCIAGIDIETGKWIRPIFTQRDCAKYGCVPSNIRLIQEQEPQLLDLIDIPLDTKGQDFGFQSENLNILSGEWKKLRQVSPDQVKQYCDNESCILYNSHKYVEVTVLKSLPFSQRKTIQLVYTEKLSIAKKNDKWKGSLNTNLNGTLTEATITDPEFVSKLKSGYNPQSPCLVTVSLSMPHVPFESWEGDDPCWKLIAGVIELS